MGTNSSYICTALTTSNYTTALATHEAIVIDGPNGVTGAPRLAFPGAATSLTVAVVVVIVAFVLLRRKQGHRVIALCLGLACLPGLWHVLVVRADAPAQRATLAGSVTATIRQLSEHSGWPQAPASVEEDGDVLFPLLRYVMPSRPPGGAVSLVARGSSLDVRCVRTGDTVECGAPR